ncbi:MAG: hypothetical protein ACFFEF_11965 [Candidatus Thorarchaeota archaeon]
MSWVAKIIEGKPDDYVHAKFVKYGIGEHPGPRAIIKLSKARISFKADLDLEKTFIQAYLHGVPRGNQKVKGTIVTYEDIREVTKKLTMPISWSVSKGKGATTFKAKLNETAPIEDIKQLLELDSPTTFYLLSMNPTGSSSWKVVTKTSFPKSPAGSDEDEEVEAKEPVFSKGSLENNQEAFDFLAKNLFPDVLNMITSKTKSIYVRHFIRIDDIEIPDDPKMSFAEKRRLAKKRGKLIRKISIDDETIEKEYDFLV